jgi:undecaprenyl pyrophosphate synthase
MLLTAESCLKNVRHVAIIADGNGRWAQVHGMPVTAGHEAGADTLKARLRDALELGFKELTLYSFSTENWSRPIEEVQGLISMLVLRIAAETPQLHREGVQMRFLGHREGTHEMLNQMNLAETLTTGNQRLTLFIAFNYGGGPRSWTPPSAFEEARSWSHTKSMFARRTGMNNPKLLDQAKRRTGLEPATSSLGSLRSTN